MTHLSYHSKRRLLPLHFHKKELDAIFGTTTCLYSSESFPFHHLLQVFEDEDDAVKYCNLLQGGGQGCEGIAEIEASSVSKLFGGP